jgi:ferrous iron transport protein B
VTVGAAPNAARGTDTTSAPPAPSAPLRVALVGNPNTGKSTLFNVLTGLRQRVGNFAGVTVERVEGSYRDEAGRSVTVLDLPGTYSLDPHTPDEAIALDVLAGRSDSPVPDVLVIVADALHLERNLYLVSQLVELGLPTVVALNQVDAANKRGVQVDIVELIHELGVTVVPTVATKGEGIDRLRRAISRAHELPRPERRFDVPTVVRDALAPIEAALVAEGVSPHAAGLEALLHITAPAHDHGPAVHDAVASARTTLLDAGLNPESLEAELRYGWITGVVHRAVQDPDSRERTTSDRVDRVLLHKVWGMLIFLMLMGLVFQSVFSWAAPLQDAIESLLTTVGSQVGALIPEGDLRSLIVDGVIAGVGGVLVFLPQIAILFLFIGILEDSGYMARAAFIMDRYMRKVGLHGRSFIPLVSGYACAVPAIMATRTIERPRDRLATIMVVPLMSCSARLPVYTLLIGAFVPALHVAGIIDLQGLVLLAMYLLGTLAALAVAFVFRRTLLRGQTQPLILELPPYRIPSVRALGTTVFHRSSLFVRRAGTVILALSVVLWALATYPKTAAPAGMADEAAQELQLANSFLGRAGHVIEPVMRPLGFDWKISVSIVSSFAAREVFVSSMGTIYGVGGSEDGAGLPEKLKAERDPVTGAPVYTVVTALALMVFYVFALMCMSTVAVTVREAGGGATGWRWAGVQFGYMFVLAYAAAWLVRVAATAAGWGA